MTLQELIARLGISVVARRLGVSPETVRKWARRGPSHRGAVAVARVIARHLAAVKGLETRKKHEKFQAELEEPEDLELPPEDALPKKPPGKSPEVQQLKRAEGIKAGRTAIDSDFNVGETEWVTVGQPVLDVDVRELIKIAFAIYRESERDYVSVKFLFFRFIPFNPSYAARGLTELVTKQGTWVEQWITTKAVSTEGALSRYIEYYMDRSYIWAETRVIFLEMIGVNTFDRKREMPTASDITRRPLR